MVHLRAVAIASAVGAIGLTVLARRRRFAGVLAVPVLLMSTAVWAASLGPLYAPYRLALWSRASERSPALALITFRGWVAASGALVLVWVLLFIVRPRRRRAEASDSHGSARWGDPRSLIQPAGLLLGTLSGAARSMRRRTAESPVLRYGRDGHLLTVAPTRSGKGVGCVIPNLLTYPGSVVVTDPKGENFAVTARQRRRMGQAVYVLDPFGAVRDVPAYTGCAAINPMDLVDAQSIDALDDARMLADMLVVPSGRSGGDQSFWDEEARALLTGLILHVASAAPPELRTLPHVRELLTLPPDPFALVIEDMLGSDACDGLVSRAAARLAQKAERERSGVISAAQNHTHFLDSPRMAGALAETTVPLRSLRTTPASVYLVLPPSRMDGYARWLRLMIGCALAATTTGTVAVRHRVLFLLDEFAHLGRMQPVERDIGLAAGYGVTFWMLVQDLAQLRAIYPDRWATFVANCEVLQAFGVNDWETAEHLSKLTGETTIQVASENRSRGVSRGHHAQRNEGEATTLAERGRRLLTADEVLRLPSSDTLLFLRGEPALRVPKLDYRGSPWLASLADENPMHIRDGATAAA